jgi:tripartite-type tricarboxylate transporter receptor subunit TctC
MKYLRHYKLFLFAALVSIALVTKADNYPTSPIKIIVPWPPGGIVDIAARLIGQKVQGQINQSLIIENVAGATGSIGADKAIKANSDGYTLLFTTSALAMNAALTPKLPYNIVTDLIPITMVATAPQILVVSNQSGITSLKQLIQIAKDNPDKLTYASAGNGSPAHFAAELLKKNQGLSITHVPYKGGPPALLDQVAGRVDIQFANATAALPFIKSGQLLALAVTGSSRLTVLPDIPTISELGINYKSEQWLGMFAPKGISKEKVNFLSKQINQALNQIELKEQLSINGMKIASQNSPEQFSTIVKEDYRRWQDLVLTAKIHAD